MICTEKIYSITVRLVALTVLQHLTKISVTSVLGEWIAASPTCDRSITVLFRNSRSIVRSIVMVLISRRIFTECSSSTRQTHSPHTTKNRLHGVRHAAQNAGQLLEERSDDGEELLVVLLVTPEERGPVDDKVPHNPAILVIARTVVLVAALAQVLRNLRQRRQQLRIHHAAHRLVHRVRHLDHRG